MGKTKSKTNYEKWKSIQNTCVHAFVGAAATVAVLGALGNATISIVDSNISLVDGMKTNEKTQEEFYDYLYSKKLYHYAQLQNGEITMAEFENYHNSAESEQNIVAWAKTSNSPDVRSVYEKYLKSKDNVKTAKDMLHGALGLAAVVGAGALITGLHSDKKVAKYKHEQKTTRGAQKGFYGIDEDWEMTE